MKEPIEAAPESAFGGKKSGGASWRSLSLPLLSVALFTALCHWPALTSKALLVDEAYYLDAFRIVSAGASPYQVSGYLYLPSFAVLGATALTILGQPILVALLRIAAVAGVVAIVWLASAPLAGQRTWRIALAAGLTLTPGVNLGLASGNTSLVVSGLVLVSLGVWPRHPMAAGCLLGGSLGIKPLAPVAILLIATHRPRSREHKHLLTASIATISASVLLLGREHLPEFLRLGSSLSSEDFPFERTVSLHRLLFNLGFDTQRLYVLLAIAAIATIVARLKPWRPDQLALLAVATICLSTPTLWTHTLLLTLPMQILAICLALSRLRPESGERGIYSRRRIYELAGVAVAVLAIQFSNGVGGVGKGPSLAVAAALLPAVIAPVAIAGYILATGRGKASC